MYCTYNVQDKCTVLTMYRINVLYCTMYRINVLYCTMYRINVLLDWCRGTRMTGQESSASLLANLVRLNLYLVALNIYI